MKKALRFFEHFENFIFAGSHFVSFVVRSSNIILNRGHKPWKVRIFQLVKLITRWKNQISFNELAFFWLVPLCSFSKMHDSTWFRVFTYLSIKSSSGAWLSSLILHIAIFVKIPYIKRYRRKWLLHILNISHTFGSLWFISKLWTWINNIYSLFSILDLHIIVLLANLGTIALSLDRLLTLGPTTGSLSWI